MGSRSKCAEVLTKDEEDPLWHSGSLSTSSCVVFLTLGAHAQRGLRYSVSECVRVYRYNGFIHQVTFI